MSEWWSDNMRAVGWAVLVVVLIANVVMLGQLTGRVEENNEILKARNALFEGLKREHEETHALIMQRCK